MEIDKDEYINALENDNETMLRVVHNLAKQISTIRKSRNDYWQQTVRLKGILKDYNS